MAFSSLLGWPRGILVIYGPGLDGGMDERDLALSLASLCARVADMGDMKRCNCRVD